MYTLTQRQYRAMKSSLTRSINTGDPRRVLATTSKAMAIFEDQGYPDDWSRWQRAAEDARLVLTRNRRCHVG